MKQGKTKAKSVPLPNAADAKSLHKLQISLSIIVALFAFILYIQSVGNDFALDDMSLIKDNKLTTQGFAGIPTILHTDILYGITYNMPIEIINRIMRFNSHPLADIARDNIMYDICRE